MTREEAIDTLKAFKAMMKIYPKRRKQKETVSQLETALDMAIKSLKTDGCKDAFHAMFKESEEAYKAWTGEDMGKTHGRLIDADKLEPLFYEHLDDRAMVGAMNAIDDAPTVEVRPHGEWVDSKWCSVCGCGIPTDVWGGGLSEEEAHYCVNCGAKMGGDGE